MQNADQTKLAQVVVNFHDIRRLLWLQEFIRYPTYVCIYRHARGEGIENVTWNWRLFIGIKVTLIHGHLVILDNDYSLLPHPVGLLQRNCGFVAYHSVNVRHYRTLVQRVVTTIPLLAQSSTVLNVVLARDPGILRSALGRIKSRIESKKPVTLIAIRRRAPSEKDARKSWIFLSTASAFRSLKFTAFLSCCLTVLFSNLSKGPSHHGEHFHQVIISHWLYAKNEKIIPLFVIPSRYRFNGPVMKNFIGTLTPYIGLVLVVVFDWKLLSHRDVKLW